jgi:DNA topoisomerase IA
MIMFSVQEEEKVIFDGYTKISVPNAKKSDQENLPSLEQGQVLKLVEVKNEKKLQSLLLDFLRQHSLRSLKAKE